MIFLSVTGGLGEKVWKIRGFGYVGWKNIFFSGAGFYILIQYYENIFFLLNNIHRKSSQYYKGSLMVDMHW